MNGFDVKNTVHGPLVFPLLQVAMQFGLDENDPPQELLHDLLSPFVKLGRDLLDLGVGVFIDSGL